MRPVVLAPECSGSCAHAADVGMPEFGCRVSCVYAAVPGVDFDVSECPVCGRSDSHDHTAAEYSDALGSFEGYVSPSQEYDGR